MKNLTKKFGPFSGGFTAVDGISFEAFEGEVLGLLGPNGAGKTTTIQMILDVIKPTAGSITIFGKTFQDDREGIMRRLNFSSTYVEMPGKLTVAENLRVFGLLFGVQNLNKRIEELIGLFRLSELRNTRYNRLSSGQRTRVNLCEAFINHPKLLLLDEPTASLDPEIADSARALIKEIVKSQQTTVIFTSHNMAEVEEMCDRVIFINHGRVAVEGTPLEVTQKIISSEEKEPDLGQVFLKIVREFGP
ncbi:MAG: ABC transporter ATP-binding protein [Patescibacteria group bacterium]|nr:ABC transporter ATP-binding protein [Patescibacteria group bacterium]